MIEWLDFRKKPIVIQAYQWFKFNYDDVVGNYTGWAKGQFSKCEYCGKSWKEHGWITTLEGGHIVCPRDWIIKGIKGEYYPCKPDIFKRTYDNV